MRTHEEILAKIREKNPTEFLPWWFEVLIEYLPLELAEEFLDGDTEALWQVRSTERAAIVKQMSDYMIFAWGKVRNHRGLSAERSVIKMEAWMWLVNDDYMIDLQDYPYSMYGAPKLSAVCNYFGFPIPDSEAISNMIKGKPCETGCTEGCG